MDLTQYIPQLSWRLLVSISCGIATMLVSIQPLSRIYTRLAAPIVKVSRRGDKVEYSTYYEGFLSLYATYFVTGVILAISGAAIGMFPDDSLAESTRVCLIWGFLIGILIVALARMSAVYLSTSLAYHVQILTVASLGILTLKLFEHFDSITNLIDNVVAPGGIRSLAPHFLVWAIVATGSVEVGIYVIGYFPRANMVSYALANERIEQYEKVQQVFRPRDITKFTEEKLAEKISTQGLVELCWLTHTAPVGHIEKALKIFKHHSRDVPEARVTEVFKAATRVLVSGHLREGQKQFLEAHTRLRKLNNAVRVRLLIINANCAIIHLPIPFTGEVDEQSNCAFFVSLPERVEKIREQFDLIWENGHLIEDLGKLIRDVILPQDKQGLALKVAYVLNKHHHPTQIDEIKKDLETLYKEHVSDQGLRCCLEGLKESGLAREVHGGVWSLPRFARSCRVADFLRHFAELEPHPTDE